MNSRAMPNSGFTILELITTLAIVAILSVIAIPSISEWIQRSQVRAETQKMVSIINLARSHAVSTNQVVTIAATENADGGLDLDIYTDTGGEGNEAFAAGDEYVRQIAGEASNVNIVANVPVAGFLSFDANGRMLPSVDADIRVINENNTLGRQIDINRMGRASVSEIALAAGP